MATTLPAGIVKKTTGYNIDPKRVTRVEGWNVRFDMGEIAALAASIESELVRDSSDGGLLNPIRVKRVSGNPTADFELIDGDRRLTAIELLMEKGVEFPNGVKAEIVERTQDTRTSTIQMLTANTGKALLPLEEASGFKRLADDGMTVAEIAATVGRTELHVRETLDLLQAPEDMKDAVQKGKVGVTTAKIIRQVAAKDADKQADLLAAATQVTAASTPAAKKAAKKALAAKIIATRDANAVAAGRAVKMRALTDDQLSAIGEKLAKHLTSLLKEAKIDVATTQAALQDWAKSDEKLAAAYVAGAMDGLKAAAGLKIELAI